MNDNGDENGAIEARWSAPPHAYCKVNVDASWEGGSKLTGLGVVVWNSNAMCLGSSCNTRLAGLAIEAEAHAALSGVHLAAQIGISHVVFESDSKELVQFVKGHIQKSRWTIFPILIAIQRVCSGFNLCSWNWVHHGANKVADAAAS
ncbi:PREDICTED: reverse mRNAase [Prunus dulcis]|uniref:PREDICTED: reverse mRNAase n=1 Tax=Prunus dulcis TaxID=3755 RepID=A0A5E4GDH3_PRUDU|nr:uncharacterized protein LOC117633230 [Prunus dulcis]VVA37662.1 PREDICTED: reverse mRNAase [Prunus dulcis]